jgi:alpha-1,6-mannosyltransferase
MRGCRAEAWLALLGAVLLALVGLGAAIHAPGQLGIGSDARRVAFVAVCLVAGGVYLLAVRLVLRGGAGPRAVWLVLGVALLLRVIVLPGPAFLSNDINRYVWDGRVQVAGINPYRYMPADPALAFLRDRTVFPFINRADTARTIYPPAAQALFFAVQRLSSGVLGVKLAMVVCELVAMAALLALLGRAGLPRARVLIYAWHPLPVWEFAGNGHVDALAIAGVALALLAAATGHRARAGAALALAVLAKVLPGVLLPALWRGRGWRLPAAFAATILLAYLPYLGVGAHVLGYLPGYAGEEGIASGHGIYFIALLSRLVPLPPWSGAAYLAAVLVLLAWFGARMLGRSATPEGLARDALLLGGTLTIALTPHYAWYFAWLLVPTCIAPSWPVLLLTVLTFTIYQDPFGAPLAWSGVLYGPPLLVAVARHPRAITIVVQALSSFGRSRSGAMRMASRRSSPRTTGQ